MKKMMLWMAAFAMLPGGALRAQNIAGAPTAATGATPSFAVATIKLNNSGHMGIDNLSLNNGHRFTAQNASLVDLMAFAYGVQKNQISGAVDWLDNDRYDVNAVPDQESASNPLQLRMMVQQLLTERFALTFHHDKRDMSAFVLTVAKGGQKLTPTQGTGDVPDVNFRPVAGGMMMNILDGNMKSLTSVLQIAVLDRPVIDQTGLTGSFDMHVTFLPDETQFHGRPMGMSADAANAAPSLFDALQQQLGLKLTAAKTAVDVIVIDHVEKPSAN
jgi:uncharacterized protein (TIGR03435 family)